FLPVFLLSAIPPPPSPTLFPYTTLFRSDPAARLLRRLTGPRLAVARLMASLCCEAAIRELVWMGEERARGAPKRSEAISLATARSEEHTSELQSRRDLVCRLLLEKKKIK